jgi:hypothetical protein
MNSDLYKFKLQFAFALEKPLRILMAIRGECH